MKRNLFFFFKEVRFDCLVFRSKAGTWTHPLHFRPWMKWCDTQHCLHVIWPLSSNSHLLTYCGLRQECIETRDVLFSGPDQHLTGLNLTRGGRWLVRGREREMSRLNSCHWLPCPSHKVANTEEDEDCVFPTNTRTVWEPVNTISTKQTCHCVPGPSQYNLMKSCWGRDCRLWIRNLRTGVVRPTVQVRTLNSRVGAQPRSGSQSFYYVTLKPQPEMTMEAKWHKLPQRPKPRETEPGLELGSVCVHYGSPSSIRLLRDCCPPSAELALDPKPHEGRMRVKLTSYCISGN